VLPITSKNVNETQENKFDFFKYRSSLKNWKGRDETKRKTQDRMERRSRKRSSSDGSEKMERVGGRQGKMEKYCSTGQSPKRAVARMEEDFF